MGLSKEKLHDCLGALAQCDPAIAAALAHAGHPEPRLSERGYETLLRTIVGQQVSIKAAQSMWNKLVDVAGGDTSPSSILPLSDEQLRAAGLSRQKASYARSLAEEVQSGRLNLDKLPKDDEDAIAQLVQVKGIGRWSAEIYLLFAEGRQDIWPAGDLAVQVAIGRMLGMAERPSEKQIRDLSEAWRPHRGALAILAWHYYKAGDPI